MYEIAKLKSKKLPELQEMAKSIGVKKTNGLKKMELIYQIIDTVAAAPNDKNPTLGPKKEKVEPAVSKVDTEYKEANTQGKGEKKNEMQKGDKNDLQQHNRHNQYNGKHNHKRQLFQTGFGIITVMGTLPNTTANQKCKT